MKPITIEVKHKITMVPGDYIIVTSEDNFVHVIMSEPVEIKEKAVIKQSRGKRKTELDLNLEQEKLVNAVLKSPKRSFSWHWKNSKLSRYYFNVIIHRLLDAKLVTVEYNKRGSINVYRSITPA